MLHIPPLAGTHTWSRTWSTSGTGRRVYEGCSGQPVASRPLMGLDGQADSSSGGGTTVWTGGRICQGRSGLISVSAWVAHLSRRMPGAQQFLLVFVFALLPCDLDVLFGAECAGPQLGYVLRAWPTRDVFRGTHEPVEVLLLLLTRGLCQDGLIVLALRDHGNVIWACGRLSHLGGMMETLQLLTRLSIHLFCWS